MQPLQLVCTMPRLATRWIVAFRCKMHMRACSRNSEASIWTKPTRISVLQTSGIPSSDIALLNRGEFQNSERCVVRIRLKWIIPLGLLLAFGVLFRILWTPTVCETKTLSVLRSPEQEYEATSVLHVCPAGFTSAVADVVSLARILTGEPPVDVVIVSEPYSDEDDPALRWSGNNTLVVEVGDRSHIYRHVVIENGASIELRRRPPAAHPTKQ